MTEQANSTAGAIATATADAGAADAGTAETGTVAETGKTAETAGTIAAPGTTAAADKAAADTAAAATATAAGAAGDKGDGKAADGKAADGKAPDAATAATDWRTRMAGDDKALLKRLERFPDEAALAKSFRELEKKFSSGEINKKPAADAKPEEVAAWRKQNGIPETADGYIAAFKADDGLVLSDEDKPIVAEIATAALAGDMTPAQYSGIVKKYYEIQEAQAIARQDADIAFKKKSDDELREAWGPDYRPNIIAIENQLAGWPEGLGKLFLESRTPDGRVLGNTPEFLRELATWARELNPMPTLVPNGGADQVKAGQARLDEIKGWMGAKRGSPEHKKYFGDEKVQAEYRQLLDGLDKLKARSA